MADVTPKLKAREVTIPEIRSILHSVLKTNIVPFIWGPPGVGKSSIVKEIAKEKNWEVIDLRLSLLNPVDLRGLPTVNHVERKANWLPPSFLPPEDSVAEGLLFLDEINLAPLSVQAAAYQLILDKRVGDYRFPKSWRIIAAGNRETDKANVFKISAPLANRFVHFTVRPDFESWNKWAKQDNIDPKLMQFLALRPTALFDPPSEQEKAFPSPRSWQFVSDMLKAFDYDEVDDMSPELVQVVFGAVGEGTGREMVEFFDNNKMQDLTERLKKFIATGNISMPRSTSQRLTLIGAVFEAYVNGKIDQVKYDGFIQKINSEERQTIKEFEANNQTVLAKKKKNPQRLPQTSTTTTIPMLSVDTQLLHVESTVDFAQEGTLLVVSRDGRNQEIIGYKNKNEKAFLELSRGIGSLPADFPVGSTVAKL